MIRAVIFRLHLSVAVAAGAVVFMLAATGAILSLEETGTGLAERRYFVAGVEGAERLGPEAIAAAAGFAATSLRYRADARAPVRVYEGRDRYARIDPYTGAVLGIGPDGLERFFEGVHNWHRWFNVSGGSVRRARAVTGAVNAAFLFLLLTGSILWIPRPVTRRSLANVILLRRGARGAWRDLNWHQVVGIWSVLPLAVIAATGVTTSYPAVGDRVYPVVATVVPDAAWPGPVVLGEMEGSDDSPRAPETDLAAVLATAKAWAPGWRTLTLNVPRPTDSEVRVGVQGGRAGQPQRAGMLIVDAVTGAALEWESFADDTPSRRAQQFLRYAHTGEYWGLAGQLLAGLFSLAAVLMVWTGLSLAVRRLRRFLRFRRALRG
ncbi:MAG: PepSY-associated TM helix domain-containing protein [Gemmatimonadota bacterium]|nr:PepSY-associated TM helix domain-containing protein [Gemmatimonadota bacterium]MDE2866498.1 PepSY-associated TM helix domain-containing protein [Gemmatimonadota bacterium]